MRLRAAPPLAGCVLVLGAAGSAGAQQAGGDWPSSGWYVGASVGAAWAGEIDQDGSNRDTICYPDNACFDGGSSSPITGYRWRYGVTASPGVGYGTALGRIFGRTRLELALAQRRHGLDQAFRSLSYYDGRPVIPRPGSTVVSNAQASIDHLRVRTVALHAYQDLAVTGGSLVPYVGIGAGPAFVTVSRVRFSTRYEDLGDAPPAYDPPLSFYDGSQEADFSDTVPAGHLHAGADYELGYRTRVGLRLTYSILGPVEGDGRYSRHAMHAEDPEFGNRNTFTGARDWILALTLKRAFGG